MAGRPSIIGEEVLRKLELAFRIGCSDREACVYAQIGESTLYDYQKKNDEFPEQKEQWKSNPVLKAKIAIYNALETGNVRIAMWYLEHKAPEEFSLRSHS